MLRKTAAELEGNGELLCMPVVITASTRSSACSLQGTASGAQPGEGRACAAIDRDADAGSDL